MDVQIAVQLLDPTGATAAQGIKQRRDPLTFGSSFPEVVTFELPFNAVPGVYQLKCTITDNYTHQTTAFERNLQLLPPSFAITSPEFHYDSDRRLDAPFGGLVNQRLYFRCNIQGFRCDDGKAELDSRIQVLDAKTRQPILPSLRTFHHTSNPLLPTDVFALTGEFALHQAGDFLLQISATDRRSGKETCIEVPLRVQSCWPADAPRVVNQLPQP
ncbi:MAG: hypothetical protein JNM56_05305 [Planctomycetia bacterium]|nr:hypothetical protein [Planctomycetia bacterium]